MVVFLTFTLAWCILVMYMPDHQTTDTGFEATYNKFIHRTLEEVHSTDNADPGGNQPLPPKLNAPLSAKPPIFVTRPNNDATLPSRDTAASFTQDKDVQVDEISEKRKQKVKEVSLLK